MKTKNSSSAPLISLQNYSQCNVIFRPWKDLTKLSTVIQFNSRPFPFLITIAYNYRKSLFHENCVLFTHYCTYIFLNPFGNYFPPLEQVCCISNIVIYSYTKDHFFTSVHSLCLDNTELIQVHIKRQVLVTKKLEVFNKNLSNFLKRCFLVL